MKSMIVILTLLLSFASYAQELQLDECEFGTSTMSFTPNSALTSMLKKEVKGSVVYRVDYRIGKIPAGPKNDLAHLKLVNNKTLEIKFFEHDAQDGIVYKKYLVSVYLSSPTKTERPVIIFSSSLYDDMPFKGKCSLMY